MPAPPETILLLGGTAEASALARTIAAACPGHRLIVSLAGRTKAPSGSAGETRTGGFGGAEGLAAYLETEQVSRLIDATHPFAAGISRNAAKAATLAGVLRAVLLRPSWEAIPGDIWTSAPCLGAARDALPARARPFLALGSQHLAPFARRSDLSPVVRMIDPPEPPLPFPAQIILGKPSADPAEEEALLAGLGVTHLVCRNSGGSASYAKLAAARALGLPVMMIARPPPPPGPVVESVEAAAAWLGIDRSG